MAASAGHNIERLVKVNEQYAQAEAYTRELLKVQGVSQWHEKQYRGAKRGSLPVHEALAAPDLRNVRCVWECLRWAPARQARARFVRAQLERVTALTLTPLARGANRRAARPREASESVKTMALELAMAQQQVAKERKARLQSMLLSEAVQYDKELAALGLAVSKNRD